MSDKPLTLDDIIDIADKAYGDDLIAMYHKDIDGNHGDGLARFIAVELRETFDSSASNEDKLFGAHSAMTSSSSQLERVAKAFNR